MTKINPLDEELLLAHVLKKPREYVLAHPNTKITKIQETRYKRLMMRRAKGEPLAYLTGHKEFFGLDFVVNKNVLIPRPDTEIMVEEVIKEIEEIREKFNPPSPRLWRAKEIFLIDVGTGSGCIPISILNHIRKSGLSVIHNTFAIDISKPALQVAKLNAKKNKVKIKFLHGDLLSPVIASVAKQSSHSQIIITANLPYLTNKQYKSSPSIQHEPKLALVANKQGLELYEKLLKQITHLRPSGFGGLEEISKNKNLKVEIFLEIDPSQTKPITLLIKKILPTSNIQIIKDLAGLDRIVKMCYTH